MRGEEHIGDERERQHRAERYEERSVGRGDHHCDRSIELTCLAAAGSWPVMIDGELAARISRGQTLELPVAPGSHILQLGSGWLKSPEVSFTVASGGQARFRARYMYRRRSAPGGTGSRAGGGSR